MGLSGGEKPCCTLQAMDPAMVDGDGIKKGNIVTTHGGRNDEPKQTIRYRVEKQLGKGLFGVVSQAKCLETGETVAIKKPRHPGWYNYSELETMRLLDHPNVVSLKHCFDDERFLYLVLEYVPETVHQVIKRYKEKNKRMPMIYVCYKKKNKRMPMIYVKLYAYQILRALAYIHGSIGVYHGDIKPENLLVDPSTHQVKLCDFGHSGKLEVSSYYWNEKCDDIWSAGCVLAELLLGEPFFRVEGMAYQLHKITQFLENTTSERPWHEIFHERMPEEREEAVDLISKLLQDSPITGVEPLIHPFFDELRDPNVCLPDGQIFPPLFNFKEHEVKGVTVEILEKLIPEHARKQCDIVW